MRGGTENLAELRMKYLPSTVLTFSTKPQICSFHDAVLPWTAKNYINIYNVLAGLLSYFHYFLLFYDVLAAVILSAAIPGEFSICMLCRHVPA